MNWSLREILRGSDGVFTLYYNTPDGATELRTRSVALTIPAYVAADLVRAAAPNASDALKCFDYPPVGAVTLAYPMSAIREDRKAADGTLPGARKFLACSVLYSALAQQISHAALRRSPTLRTPEQILSSVVMQSRTAAAQASIYSSAC